MKNMLLCFLVVTLIGCVTSTKKELYPKVYEEKPVSLLIFPVINNSTDAEAPLLYPTTLAESISNAGYYVFPIEFTNRFFQKEGILSGEQLRNVNTQKFREYFGADAVLRITINKWDTSYIVISSGVSVKITIEMISTKTNEVIWLQNRELRVSSNNGGGSLLGAIVSAAINAASTRYIDVAKNLNGQLFHSIPFGKYHEGYMQDQDQSIPDHTSKADTE